MKCCRDALKCCKQIIENYQVENFFNTCDAHWDGANCFTDTHPGLMVEKPCPFHMIKYDESTCNRKFSSYYFNFKLKQIFVN